MSLENAAKDVRAKVHNYFMNEAPQIGLLYDLSSLVMQSYESSRHNIQVEGSENYPQGGFLMGVSHEWTSDPWVASLSMPKKKITYIKLPLLDRRINMMAKDELWSPKYHYFGYFLRLLGAFPVDRVRPGHSTVRHAMHLLRDDEPVAINTEGTRKKTDVRGPHHASIGVLAVLENKPVLPVGIAYIPIPSDPSAKIAERISSKIRNGLMRVVVGKAIHRDEKLSKTEAVQKVMDEYAISLQRVYERANGWAKEDLRILLAKKAIDWAN